MIKNRANAKKSSWGNTVKDVCLAPQQFSCWNGKDSMKIDDENAFNDCKKVAEALLSETQDPTSGATHYFNASITTPSWASKMTFIKKVGNHDFYKE